VALEGTVGPVADDPDPEPLDPDPEPLDPDPDDPDPAPLDPDPGDPDPDVPEPDALEVPPVLTILAEQAERRKSERLKRPRRNCERR
jgi:hypothetical protein